jgi:replication factor A1
MNAAIEKSVSPDGISKMLSIPKPDSFTHLPEIILQVTNLEPKGKSYGYLSIYLSFFFFFLYFLSSSSCFSFYMYLICLWFCRFDASDGKVKIKAIFSSRLSSEILSGNIQNLCLIRVLDYTVNEIPSKSEK